jgi:protein-S-isoprenylcysteine O-methyltransferase Ste14
MIHQFSVFVKGVFLGRVLQKPCLDWPDFVLASLATLSLSVTAKIEEAENLRYFGEAYHTYMRQTKMFVPFLF